MKRPNYGLESLLNSLSSPTSKSVDRMLESTLLSRPAVVPAPPIPSPGDSSLSRFSTKETAPGIQFGRPSNARQTNTNGGSSVTDLIGRVASGGLSNALGGFGSIAGLGGLIGGLVGLFGGGTQRSTPPPLVEFQLPQSVDQALQLSSVSSKSSAQSLLNTNATQNASRYDPSQVAQAVKTALLNSSSLIDVISEI